MGEVGLQDALAAALATHFRVRVCVEALTLLAGGASRRIYGFEAEAAGRAERLSLVARFGATPGRIRGSGVDEYALISAAHDGGVAVPRIYCRGRVRADDGSHEEFFVMERLRGEAIARRLLRDNRYARARERLPEQIARSLARVHTIDVCDARLASLRANGDESREVVEAIESDRQATITTDDPARRVRPRDETTEPRDFASREIARYRELLAAAAPGHPMPVLSLTARWLERNRPPLGNQAVVHGDFRIGNLMFDEDGLTGVLDWELAHLGDPLEDLGWLAVRAWRFGNDDRPIGGLCSREEFWALYEREGGARVDPAAARYWEIFGNWKWAVICVMQGASHKAGGAPDVELAAIGRRVAETEWEILALLEEADRARQA